jgi:hypothetical protein
MSDKIIQALPELRPHSNVTIPDSVVCGINNCFSGPSFQLVKLVPNPNDRGLAAVLTKGAASLPKLAKATRLRQRLPAGVENNLTHSLNDALLGGEQYPITTMIAGIIAGYVSAGAGFLFAAASTALSASQKAKRILARENDEIWQVEEIGKIKSSSAKLNGSNWDVVHVGSYFLVDPYRRKSWLIHETRAVVQL